MTYDPETGEQIAPDKEQLTEEIRQKVNEAMPYKKQLEAKQAAREQNLRSGAKKYVEQLNNEQDQAA